MSRLLSVIKSKNRIAKAVKKRRNEEISNMRALSMYKVKLIDDLKIVKMMLDDNEVDSVTIKIPKEQLNFFLKAMYSEELNEYSITQEDADLFSIGRKEINY